MSFDRRSIASEDELPATLLDELKVYELTGLQIKGMKAEMLRGALEGAKIAAEEVMGSIRRWLIIFTLTNIAGWSAFLWLFWWINQ